MVQSGVDVSSGYCIVHFRWKMCLKVSAIPFSVARTYDESEAGRRIVVT